MVLSVLEANVPFGNANENGELLLPRLCLPTQLQPNAMNIVVHLTFRQEVGGHSMST